MHSFIQSKFTSFGLVALVLISVAVHDTKIDAAAALSAVPLALIAVDSGKTLLGKSMAHTHIERAAITRTADKHTSWMPRTKLQGDNDSRQTLAKKLPRGHHPFDLSTIPL